MDLRNEIVLPLDSEEGSELKIVEHYYSKGLIEEGNKRLRIFYRKRGVILKCPINKGKLGRFRKPSNYISSEPIVFFEPRKPLF